MPTSIRILHVDDEPGFAEMVSSFLEREMESVTVETATSASDGLNYLHERDVDCVVSDYEMPGLNGLEFLETVRAENPDLPFLLFTGKGSEEIASDAISAGVTDYLQKGSGPEQYAVLANRVENAVARNRAESRYRDLIESAPYPIYVYADNEIVYANEAAATFFGAETSADLVGVDPIEMAEPVARDRIAERVETVQARQTSVAELEVGFTTFDGKQRYAVGTGSPVTYGGLDAVRVTLRDVTEERERQHKVQLFRTLLDQSNDGIYIVDPESGTIVDVNDTACHRLGFTYDELVGKPVEEIVATVSGHDDPCTALGDLPDRDGVFEGRHERNDGTTYPVETSVSRATVDDHRYLIVVARDVTERRAREQNLREREARFRTLFAQSADAIFLHDTEGRILEVNQQACDSLGYDYEELVGKTIWDIAEDPEREVVMDRWASMTPGEVETFNGRHRRADGGTFPIEIRVARLETGGDAQFVATARDVTQQMEHEQELERVRTRMSHALEATDSVIWEWGIEADHLTRHGPVERMFGVDPDEVGTSLEEFLEAVHEDDRDRVATAFEDVRTDRTEAYHCEFRVLRPDGVVRWFESQGRIVGTEEGRARLLGLTTDVTPRKKRQEELQRQNDRLAEFADIVSHDLRNPLNVAAGSVALARMERESDHLEKARNALDRMEALIQDLLRIAREGVEAHEKEPVDLDRLIEACLNNVDTERASVNVETDRTVFADESRVQQLLENLLRNSIDHGGPDVTVTVGDTDGGFYVEDDGPGIPAEERERVFESGFSTAERGTGLGLSIVKGVADDHGWDVHLTESSTGGVRFEISGVSNDATEDDGK